MMKKITQLLTILLAIMAINQALAQKASVIGTNHVTNDGFAFLVTQDLVNGENVYFTEDEYNNSTNLFGTGESVVRFTASGAISTGTVVYIEETATANTFTVTCTGGGSCGTATHFGGGFSLRTGGEAYYAYQDTDAIPSNGVTEIYSVFYTGESGQATGGAIPAIMDPTPDYPNAIVVDGFPAVNPGRAEYVFAGAGIRDGLCRDNLENVSNYLHGQGYQALNTTAFNSFTLACTSPTVTLTRTPAAVAENSGSGITYTFTISPTSGSPTTVNFNVSGSATFSTDYTQTGAATFNATSGTVVIGAGSSIAAVTLTPVGDTTLEPDETMTLTLAAGAGYTAGSPSIATGTITNDDTQNITPVVAVTGLNNAVAPGIEGFSFVALDDIAAGTEVFFTEEEFNRNTLAFSNTSGEGVVRWTAPAGGVLRGEVIVATENSPDVFTASCNSGTCGTFTTIVTGFTFASNGEGFFAYSDSDTDPTNGVTQVHSVLYTGNNSTPGGNIPALEDPSSVYVGAVVVDGFPAVQPQRTEYRFPPERGVTVDQANFQNITNWFHAQAPATLSTVPFANIIIVTGSANPTLTLAAAPTSTVEDSGVGMVYTFTLSAAATSNITVNFTVGGTATLTTDYTVSGADTFTATTGTATIPNGSSSVAVTVTPVVDAIVEPTETVELMIASGTGYDGGTPNSATGSITNDDTSASDPLVAIMGMSHAGPDGFSFVAAQDIPGGTVVYFSEDEFDNTTLLFSAGEAVLQWTSPAGQIDQGDVITVTEGGTPDTFTVACSDTSGNGCGTISVIVGGFAMATNGESLFAFTDSDTDPTNGVTDIYSVMYTGNSGVPGGNLPAIEDPTGIYLNALVVDGFPPTAPVKTEYTPASRGIPVGSADFENPANYDHAFAFGAGLSTVPFASISIVVDFTAPADLCVDAGVQAGLGGGTPTGGFYSGPGVTDDGNGMTYSFDPAAAGVGTHPITYTLGGSSASDNIEVFALPTVTFTAPADLCVDAGVQAGLGGGTPTGGVYSGTGVTDDGNGMTYSFDPAAAGVGTHTITYTFTDTNGCTNSASDDVEVFALPTVTFTALADLCVNAGVQAGLGGGTPTGGVYSGTGVTDDGNGMTYSFDPAAAGVGTHTLTYTFTDANGCSASATDDVEVFALPIVAFTAPADLCVDAGVQAGLGGGTPTGGVYSGPGVTDDGNGMTYSFDPAAAGVGVHTITYTFTDANGCTASASDMIEVFALPTVTFTAPADLCVNAGVQVGLGGGTPTGGFYSGPGVTDDGNGMTYSFDPAAAGVGTHTLTYTFTDTNGCISSASDMIEVFALPTVTFTALADLCVDAGVQAGLGGGVPTGGVYSGTGVTDDGNGMTYSFDPAAAGVGTHTITYTFTDTNGCTASASDDVEVFALPTVTFTAPASPVCPNATLTGLGGGTPTGGVYSGPGVTDDGNGMTYTFDAAAAGTGTHTITYTFTDTNGCTNSASDTVTVEDTTPPAIVCPANITVNNDPGVCEAVVTYTPPVGTDNCSGATTTQIAGLPSGSAFPVGTTTNTFEVTDIAGNTTQCSFDVTVNDVEAPSITCPADIAVSNDPGICGAVVNYTVTGMDNCLTGSPITLTFTGPDVFGTPYIEGLMVVTANPGQHIDAPWTVPCGDGDGMLMHGNTGNNWVYDGGAIFSPTSVEICANPTTFTFTSSKGGTFIPTSTGVVSFPNTADWIGITSMSWDNTSGSDQSLDNFTFVPGGVAIVQTAGLPSGAEFPVGTTTNTYVITDSGGNSASCSFDVTVNDTEDPVLTCPADITVNNDPGNCSAAVTVPTPTIMENCPGTTTTTAGPVTAMLFSGGDLIDTPSTITGLGTTVLDVILDIEYNGDFTTGSTSECFTLTGPDGIQIFQECGGGPTCDVINSSVTIPAATWNNWIATFGSDLTFTLLADPQVDSSQCSGPGSHEFQLTANTGFITLTNDFNGTSDASGTYPVGTTTVTWTATDAAGNTGTCSMTVTVNDTEDPVVTCPTDITVGNDPGQCSAVVTFTPTIADNCPGATVVSSPASGSVFPVGTTVVTVTGTDAAGNTATCTFNVTVDDTENPTISCPADITVNNDTGDCGAVVTYAAPTGTDNCPSPTTVQTGGLPSGSVFPVGTTTNTFEVTDASGNTASCSFTVTVIDNEDPTITCPADITASNDPGVCEAAITVPQPTFDDNCFTNGCVRNDDLESYTLGSMAGQDPNWVGWTGAAAEAGEVSTEQAQSGTQSLKIEGVPAGGPVDQIYNLGNLTSGVWEVTYSLYIPVGNTAFTNIQKFERPAGGPEWGHQIQWNSNGTAEYNVNSGYNTFTYPQGAWFEVRHYIDLDNDFTEFFVNGASVISHPYSYQAFSSTGAISLGGINFFPITNFFGGNGSETNPAAIPLFYVDDVSMCAVAINDYNNTADASDTYPVGTTNVVWTVTDAGGNTASCTQQITVEDTEDPVITCPADITVNNDTGICGAQVFYAVTATDNCATIIPGTVSINPLKDNSLFQEIPGNSNGAGQLMYVGQNGVSENHRGVLTFDVAGSVPAGATITGVNLTMTADHPTATNGAHDFNLHRLLEDWGEGASDNGVAPGSGGGGFGDTAVAPDATWNDAMLGTAWASGPGGNFNPASSAVQNVDANGPYTWTSAALMADVQDMLDNPGTNFGWIVIGNETTASTTKRFGTRESPIAPVLEISYEIVAGVTITQTAGLPSGSTFPVGTTTNTFVVTDTAGNTDTCSFNVTVNDTEPPIAVCQDITVQLDANGMASITAADIDNGSSDNCGIASLAVSPSSFDCSNVGPNTVTLTVTDVNGNSSTCTATVTVEDNVAPDAVCMDIDLFLDATGNASITPADVDGGSSDACGIVSLAIDITDFTCADVGPNDVTLTVTDVNGNVSSCIAVVTVIDNTPPVISCPADVVTGTDPGLCSAQVVFSDAIASDECGIASVVQTAGLPSGSDFPVGVSTIEFTATDVNGNTTVCSFTITVNDDEPAMAVCQDITIQLDDTGIATITASDVDGGSTDNCGIASLDIDIDTFDCSNVGDNPVVLTVTDDNGNTSTCTAIVTVEDVTAPEVFCQDIIVDLDATGTVTILPTDVDNGSTDACGIATYELDIDTFDCSNVGDNIVTLTVTDVNGNSASCTATVTVQDVTDPVLTCMDITVELDENGMAVIEPEDVIDTLDDACGIFTTAIDIFEFTCDDIGTPITVQVFAQDNNGNLATCTAEVTVVDALAPELTCPADQTVDPGPGMLFYEIPDYFATGEATAVDNCTDPVTDVTQDPAPGTLVPDGVYTITLTATDDSGNTATCTFELTVESVLGLDDLPVDLSTIVVYPNPATDVVFISNPQNIALEKVTLFDLVGRKVATYDLRNSGIETSLDISNLATASYTMVIEGSGGQLNKRLIKE
ncbi:HYR domain-containing protein [Aureisphaera galaxeae]|uniref:HYR domain-containing protein n=1 Tax=Aureisphaera galaxeae TaxID=1538023 RepID=UPI00234FD799|nr:HYR domain-containing protein [Aureisphaera galaxeae]MDC8004521.1 HYR domain-containing protein [Aureisphaera galaxeae]